MKQGHPPLDAFFYPICRQKTASENSGHLYFTRECSHFHHDLSHIPPERWVNLWWQPDFATNILSSCEPVTGANIGGPVFVGNIVLVVGILLSLFLLHVVVISGVEAYWLTKARYDWSTLFVRDGLFLRFSPSWWLGLCSTISCKW